MTKLRTIVSHNSMAILLGLAFGGIILIVWILIGVILQIPDSYPPTRYIQQQVDIQKTTADKLEQLGVDVSGLREQIKETKDLRSKPVESRTEGW